MNRNVPEPGNPVIVRKRNKKNDPGTGSGKTGMGTTNGRSKGMEQEHGTDAAAICKGVLLRIGMAAAMATAVLIVILVTVFWDPIFTTFVVLAFVAGTSAAAIS